MNSCVICGKPLSGQKIKFCSNRCKQKHHYHHIKTQTNTYHSQTIRALKRKLKFVEELGGMCQHCGYNKNLSALHFHHLEAEQKEFPLGLRSLSNKREDSLRKELKKCILLCANCHAEEHNPELQINNVVKLVHGDSMGKPMDAKGVNSGKP